MESDTHRIPIRESTRARTVRLKASVKEGLSITVPAGFDRSLLDGILRKNQPWIERQLERIAGARKLLAPSQVELQAIGKTWSISYQQTPNPRVTVKEGIDGRLLVQGKIDDPFTAAAALQSWLKGKARRQLKPWLKQVGLETRIKFGKVRVGAQSSRWGSCSKIKTISLNCNLLFLPPPWVRYVFLHELCHIKQFNHSKGFWDALSSLEPNCRELQTQVKKAHNLVPVWASQR